KFLDSLRIAIIEDGIIRRSQTVLDGTIHTLLSTETKIKEQSDHIKEIHKKLVAYRGKNDRLLQRNQKKYGTQIEQLVIAQFAMLREQASKFANEYYEEDADTIQSAWECRVKSIGFQSKLK